jgi:uncharacterized protein
MILVLQLFGYVLVFYLCCVALMYLGQERLIFHPTSSAHQRHQYRQVEGYSLQRGPVTLGGWLLHPERASDKLLIYYGGNAEDVFLNIEEYQAIEAATLFVAYRGYGPSGGKPGEQELYGDALAVFDDMASRKQPRQVFLIGRSLGSALASYVAAHRPVQGVVLITPFDSLAEVARGHYPWLPVDWLLKHRFPSADFATAITCPVLVIYGGRDQVVTPQRTENLLRHLPGTTKQLFLPQAEHGTIDMHGDYWRALLAFLDQSAEQ